jgi:V/A-type H+-transporting ATPase subunit C
MISRILPPDLLRSLAAAPDLEGALRSLLNTVYEARVTGLLESGATIDGAEIMLASELVRAYRRVIGLYRGGKAALLVQMAKRLELDNLKTILRGKVRGEPQDEISSLLWPLGSLSTLPTQELLLAQDVEAVAASLADTEYRRVMQNALPRYISERSLFPVEVALDLHYYRSLWDTLESLSGQDRSVAGRVMDVRYDLLNIDWIIRYRVIFNLSPEEIYNYTLPYARLIDGETIRSAASAEGIAGIVAVLPEPYRSLLSGPASLPNPVERSSTALQRFLVSTARSALAGYPFHLGVAVSYLWLKEAEIHDLRLLFEGKRYGASTETIIDGMWGAF